MTPRLRKFALTAHIGSSVAWIGAVAGFLALAVGGLTSQDAPTARAAYVGMERIAWFVIVLLAFAALSTGLVQSLGTSWGLFRHYWVVVKLVLTVVSTIVLVIKLKLIGYAADAAAQASFSGADLRQAGIELVVHAGGGLVLLLVPLALSVYKPWGLTPYGRRKQAGQRPAPSA